MSDQVSFDKDTSGKKAVAEPKDLRQDTGPSRNVRLPILLTVLVLLLFAVWYDYKVARPRVDEAYSTVSKLINKHNGSASIPALTNVDVQKAFGFRPSYSLTENEYLVEVYDWNSGLPFRSHSLYAVYRGEANQFMRHYKFFLPIEDLTPKPRAPELSKAKQPVEAPQEHVMETVGPHVSTDPESAAEQPSSEGSEQSDAPEHAEEDHAEEEVP